MGERLTRFTPKKELKELINKPSDLDLVTAIIYYSGIKKVTETDMLKFLKEKKEEGKNPKFFKEFYLPGISDFSIFLGSSDVLFPRCDGWNVDRTLKAKRGVSKRIKEVFDFKERRALKNLGNQFKKIIQKEQGNERR